MNHAEGLNPNTEIGEQLEIEYPEEDIETEDRTETRSSKTVEMPRVAKAYGIEALEAGLLYSDFNHTSVEISDRSERVIKYSRGIIDLEGEKRNLKTLIEENIEKGLKLAGLLENEIEMKINKIEILREEYNVALDSPNLNNYFSDEMAHEAIEREHNTQAKINSIQEAINKIRNLLIRVKNTIEREQKLLEKNFS